METPGKLEQFIAWAGPINLLVLKALETVTLLGVFAASCYGGFALACADVHGPRYARMIDLVHLFGENWKALLLILLPLFYRSTRTFVDEVQEVFGMKRPRTTRPTARTQEENPPTGVP